LGLLATGDGRRLRLIFLDDQVLPRKNSWRLTTFPVEVDPINPLNPPDPRLSMNLDAERRVAWTDHRATRISPVQFMPSTGPRPTASGTNYTKYLIDPESASLMSSCC
jgi:hypothetical protein